MEQIFWTLLILKLLRHLLPWVAGLLVSLVIVSLGPLPPLAALLVVVVVTTWIAWAIEVKVLRAFERRVPGTRDIYDPRWANPRNRRWR